MTKQKLWELIEAYRMSGGSEEHHARKEQLDAVLDGLLAQHDSVQAKPEPEQEPVALQMDVIVVNLVREGINKHRARELAEHFIKHTTPPQRTWIGLTDEDKQTAFDETQEGGGFWEFADAIEAKLKEKNT